MTHIDYGIIIIFNFITTIIIAPSAVIASKITKKKNYKRCDKYYIFYGEGHPGSTIRFEYCIIVEA